MDWRIGLPRPQIAHPSGVGGWPAAAESRRAGAHQWSCASGERKEGEKGSLLGPQGQEPIPSRAPVGSRVYPSGMPGPQRRPREGCLF